jgi:hypothetical protein
VLHLCSVSELSGPPSENRRILYRQNEVQQTQCSLFPIYRRLPKLDVNPVVGSLAGSGTINALGTYQSFAWSAALSMALADLAVRIVESYF